MNKFALSALVLAAVGTASAQQGKVLISTFAKKFNDAKSVTVSYRSQVVGGLPLDFSVTLSKPDKVRIETPIGFAVADGALISIFRKSDNSYTQTRETPGGLSDLFQMKELHLWRVFFDPATFARAPEALLKGKVKRKGKDFTEVDTTLDMSGDHFENFFFDDSNIPRQAELIVKSAGTTTLLDVDSITLGDDMLDGSHFEFVAPAGSHRG